MPQEALNMDDRYGKTSITEQDWVRLRSWSFGYDDGWNGVQFTANPVDFHGNRHYAAGFVRGQKDRLEAEREQPH